MFQISISAAVEYRQRSLPVDFATVSSGWSAARSGRNRLGLAEEAAVGGAARAGRQPFMGERHGDVTLTGTHGRFDQCPVDDVALRVAAADLP
jgi:hypothetical protein